LRPRPGAQPAAEEIKETSGMPRHWLQVKGDPMVREFLFLRNASINRINGMIGMTFSCDGTHYIDHRTFFERLDSFGQGRPAE
jgi:hypothetical protein